jgi:hypothetical protein
MATTEDIKALLKKKDDETTQAFLEYIKNPFTKEETEKFMEYLLKMGEEGTYLKDSKERQFVDWYMRNQSGMDYKMTLKPSVSKYGLVSLKKVQGLSMYDGLTVEF